MPRREATLEACRLRLRPIVMTSFAFILGVVPLIISHGAGAEMRQTLGTAVFSGMLGVTLFGIFLTPVFFYTIDWLGETRLFAFAAACGTSAGIALVSSSDVAARRRQCGAAHRPRASRLADQPLTGCDAVAHVSAERQRANAAKPACEEAVVFSQFFINRPIFASVLSIIITLAGVIALFDAADRAVSGDHAADGRSVRRLSRRQRPGRRRHRGRPDRAAGQRRRGHAVHVVAVHQRRHLHPDRHVPERRRSEHGPGAGAEPRLAGPADPARPGQAPRRDGQEEIAQRADDRQPVLARQQPRQPVPEQLRHHPAQGRAVAAAGRRRHHLSRPARLQHAALARPGEDGVAQPDGHRRDRRHRAAEHAGRGRADRPAAGRRPARSSSSP